jgi:glycosyltransferase involved in cell wall biosynthesis
MASVFIALSEFSRAKHREFGFPIEMEVLPCFLPDPEATEVAAALPEFRGPRPYFLFAGRLEALKGIHEVVTVFRHYEEADLVIAGDGEEASALAVLAAGCPRVCLLGRLSLSELDRQYRHAVTVITPSPGRGPRHSPAGGVRFPRSSGSRREACSFPLPRSSGRPSGVSSTIAASADDWPATPTPPIESTGRKRRAAPLP